MILQEAEKMYGPIEMVVCCAAISKPAMFLSSEVSSYRHHMDLNFFGVLNFIHPIVKRMVIRRNGGRIAIVGDPTVVEKAIPGMGAYACSKGALEQLAYQLKAELEPYNIKVHYFLPNLMETPMLKQQREFYILPTKLLLGNKQTITPEEAA
jgi:NAD(P)-dependent dehydrogenase (short-subunit alcohol dehydrogenase family)